MTGGAFWARDVGVGVDVLWCARLHTRQRTARALAELAVVRSVRAEGASPRRAM